MTSKRIAGYLLAAILLILIMALALVPAQIERSQNKVVAVSDFQVTQAAHELHQQLIVGDWHSDSLLWKRNLAERSDRGHVDIPRLQEGNVALQMFTTVTKSPAGQNYHKNKADSRDNITVLGLVQLWPPKTWNSLSARALYQAEKLEALVQRDAENVRFIKSQRDLTEFLIQRQSHTELVGALLGTEGSHALDGKLENIELLYAAGFRMMSLQHFFDNKLGGSLHGQSQQGLTDFGRDAIARMQALDIIVDVSHSSEQVVADVLALANKPLVVSHTGFSGHCDSPRNINDSLMQAIASQGGLIAVGFWDGAICQATPAGTASAIKYGIGLVGENHVSLGSDYDGSVSAPFDTSGMAVLTQALMDAGINQVQIRKVMGGNMLRFLQQNLPRQ